MEGIDKGEDSPSFSKEIVKELTSTDGGGAKVQTSTSICSLGGEGSSKEPSNSQDIEMKGDKGLLDGVALQVEVIRRPRSSPKKRNYRQTTGTDACSSGDDEEPKSTSTRLDESSSHCANDGCISDKQLTNSELENCVKSTQEEMGILAGPSSSTGENTANVEGDKDEDMSRDSAASNLQDFENLPCPIRTDASSSDSEGSSFLDHVEPNLAFYPGGVEIEDLNMSSSSSSSLDFMHEEDELEDDDTSESSDSLDDLQDLSRPIIERSNNSSSRSEQVGGNPNKNCYPEHQKKKKDLPLPKVLLKPKPKCSWSGPKQMFQREIGLRTRVQAQSAEIFRSKFYGSLFSAERLELMIKLDGHDGCVNCLNFNSAGTKLMSGSDDLEIKIWNYGVGKLLTSFNSKHRSNVFQAKFMPLIGMDNIIVSCARDSQVRLTELDSSGNVASSRKLAQHRGPVHKVAISPETPHVVLSCGEDGVVHSCDIREDKSQKILSLMESGRRISLYSIHTNPIQSHEFCVCGRDEYVRIYDTRKLTRSSSSANSSQSGNGEVGTENDALPLKRFCPHHLQGHQSKPHITAAVYNYNGTEIIASYNDENIYLFDTSHSDLADYTNVYEGHLNSATVKGVNFFGDKSQFIVSGSDCSHIFIWDKQTESIVNFFRGDEKGVVNCLEPHPSAPMLATSGLDDDIKVWIPSSETPPKMGDLASTVRRNIKKRNEEMESRPNALDGQIMWQLIHHLHREQRRNRREADAEGSDTNSSSDGDGDEADPRGVECVIA